MFNHTITDDFNWISFKKTNISPAPLSIWDVVLERITKFNLLGVLVQNDLKFNSSIHRILSKKLENVFITRGPVGTPIYQPRLGSPPIQQRLGPMLEYLSAATAAWKLLADL